MFPSFAPGICTIVVTVQSLSPIPLFATPQTAACQASLSTVSQSLLKLMSLSHGRPPTITSAVTPLHCPQSLPASRSFLVNQLFPSRGYTIRASASAAVLSIDIQGWFPLRVTGLISLLSKGLSRLFFSTTVWTNRFFSPQSFLWSNYYIRT